MKTTLLCSFCDDAIDIGDTAICKNCVDELHKNIKKLQARIAELEAALDKAAHHLYDHSGSCPSDLYDWEDHEAWKCWRLWLMCPAPQEEK